MKKILIFAITLSIILSLSACVKTSETEHGDEGNSGTYSSMETNEDTEGDTASINDRKNDNSPYSAEKSPEREYTKANGNGDSEEFSAAEPEAYAFSAQYIRTNGYTGENNYPYAIVIESKDELIEYYETYKDTYDLERKEKVYSDTTIGFLDACDKYDDEYFEKNNLIIVVLEEPSGSIRHEVTDIRRGADGDWNITIDRKVPEAYTCDMAEWHMLIELKMERVITKDDVININSEVPYTIT